MLPQQPRLLRLNARDRAVKQFGCRI